MTQKDNGGPAFPLQSIGPDFPPGYSGMTLRDWFAGQTLVGLFAGREPDGSMTAADWAKSSYLMADAMLAERSK